MSRKRERRKLVGTESGSAQQEQNPPQLMSVSDGLFCDGESSYTSADRLHLLNRHAVNSFQSGTLFGRLGLSVDVLATEFLS